MRPFVVFQPHRNSAGPFLVASEPGDAPLCAQGRRSARTAVAVAEGEQPPDRIFTRTGGQSFSGAPTSSAGDNGVISCPMAAPGQFASAGRSVLSSITQIRDRSGD
jgi:hypothetical protein